MAEKRHAARTRDYFFDEGTSTLKINCLGKPYGPSIEDYPEVMARVIDALMEVRAENLVLIGSREHDYGQEQVKLLSEIAQAIQVIMRDKLISYRALGTMSCQRCYPDWVQRVQFIVADLMRKDPVGAYAELLKEIAVAREKIRTAGTSKLYYDCFSKYVTNILYPLKAIMEKTALIRKIRPQLSSHKPGDRRIYKELFSPTSRPNFMLTKFMTMPPAGGLLDEYKVGDIKVGIYRIPESTQNLYFVIPPEFVMSKEKYAILDHAKSYMAAHKPTTAEFVKSEKVREIFYNVGRDTIRETAERMRVSMTTKDIEQIASILTRYTAGMGILEVLLADEKIQDIYINAPAEREPVLIFHQDWEDCKTNLIPTREDAEIWATRLRIQSGRPLDEANPVLDTEMSVPGGNARFAVITKTLSPYGIGFAIRRHRDSPWTLPLFIKNRYMNPLAAGLLSFFVDGSVSMLVAGGRSSGKTSLLGALMLEMLPKTRIVTLEDSVTGDCEIVYERNGEIKKGTVGNLIDELIEKYGKLSLGRNIVDGNPEGIKVFSMAKSGKISLSLVSKFIRHAVNKDIFEIETKTGRKIKVTGDHSLFTLGEDGDIEPIEARKLQNGDYIITPRILPTKSKEKEHVDILEHIEKYENVYLIDNSIGEFIKNNKEIVSKTAKGLGYFIKGPLKGMTQWWKRNNVLPLSVIKELNNIGYKIDIENSKIKFSKNSRPIQNKIPLSKDFLTFMGLWIADGYYDSNSVIISVAEEEARNVVYNTGKMFGLKPYMHSDKFSLMLNSTSLKNVMKNVLGLKGDAFTKRIPEWVFNLSKEQIGYVLNGVFSGDGYVSDKEIVISLRSKQLIKDIQTALLLFGIVGRVSERDGFYNCRIGNIKSLKPFLDNIGLLQKKKIERLKNLCNRISTHDTVDIIPLPLKIKEDFAKLSLKFNKQDYLARENNIGREHLGSLLLDADYDDHLSERLFILANSDIFWDGIKSIKSYKKEEYVYDFSVPGKENFICENILAHNTLELPVEQLRELNFNIERLKTRSVITRVETEMPADEALRTALRLGDSALIVGEVRSVEARALYEAMRIGALSNVVAGTIHGESAYGVFDRVVNDLEVPKTSFKATDIIPIAKMLRSADGLHRFRRLTEITEVRKEWEDSPLKEGGFVNLMEYSGKDDGLKPTEVLLNGDSQIIKRISSFVKEWYNDWDAVWENINLRAKMKDTIVKYSEQLKRPDLLEAPWIVKSNERFHIIQEAVRKETGAAEARRVYAEWLRWYREALAAKMRA